MADRITLVSAIPPFTGLALGSITIGVLAGIVSTCVQSIGLTLQRQSHLMEASKEAAARPAYRRRRWQIGMLLFLLANIVGSGIQITTLPLPVLSALQACGLVFNAVCASVLLEEPFTRMSIIGVGLVSGGALLIALFGAISEPFHTLPQLLVLMGRPSFLLWLGATFVFGAAVLASAKLFEIASRSGSRVASRANFTFGMASGCVSGILSAHTLLVAKSAVELVVRTVVDGHNQFTSWPAFAIVGSVVVFALAQLAFLHSGLKRVSTSVLYPFVFCVFNVVSIFDGLIYFDQSDRLSMVHASLVGIGTTVLLMGVVLLSWRLEADPKGSQLRRLGISADIEHAIMAPSPALVTPDTARRRPLLSRKNSSGSLSERTPLLSGSFDPSFKIPRVGENEPSRMMSTSSLESDAGSTVYDSSQDRARSSTGRYDASESGKLQSRSRSRSRARPGLAPIGVGHGVVIV